jgi:hypothetical protein
MKTELVLLDGSARRFALEEGCELTVGTAAKCTVRLSSADVSRTHALLTFQRGTLTVLDLGSTNGTFLNGRRVKEAELAPGDVVRFSSVIAQIMPEGRNSSGAFEVAVDSTARQAMTVSPDPELTSGEVPIILLDSLLWLLRRWDIAGGEALVALVEWLVAQRGMRGAAIAEEVDGATMLRAAHGECTGVLDAPGLGAVVRAAAQHHDVLESVQLRLGQREVIVVHGTELPCLLIVPGKAMPASSEIELYAALLRVAQRLVALPVAVRAGEKQVRAR